MFRSITFKFLAFLISFSLILGGTVLFFFVRNGSIPTPLFLIAFIVYGVGILAFFLFSIANPLFQVVQQIKLLLTGKKYRRINSISVDEIGVVTHFFNKITLNLESISSDIAHTKRLSTDLDVARKIQRDILPKEAPSILGLDIVARSRPATEMGGDSFDFVQQDTHTMIYIGDATGHSVPSGLVMMMVNTLIHAFAENGMMPHEILTRVNTILNERVSAAQFMSLAMLRWDEKRQKMFYIGAGHEYILIYRAKEKTVEKIRTGGIALRMAPDIERFIEEKDLPLADDDVVLLYSDGITEGKNPRGEMYGVDRLLESLQKNGTRSTAAKIFDGVSNDFSKFMENYDHQEDDVTMIVIKKLSPGTTVRTPIKLTIGGLEESFTTPQKKWEWEE